MASWSSRFALANRDGLAPLGPDLHVMGMLLLIVPGIILGIRLQMYVWAIVDNHAGPIEALQQSWTMTRGFAWNLLLLNLLLGLINMLGMLALGIGLIVTVPLSMVAWGHAYRRLEGSAVV